MKKQVNVQIIATGGYLPEKVLTNDDLSKTLDTSDEWIYTRTGIKSRHIAAEDEFTSDLAYKAALNALTKNNIDPSSIDAVIVASVSPDFTFPAVATQVHEKLKLKPSCFAFDLQAACAGFLVALSTAQGFIASGMAKRVLIIGAEAFSKFIDWNDRSTAILFGDGAGAAILEASSTEDKGILGISLGTDGSMGKYLYSNGGVATTNTSGHIVMNGKEVFRQAVTKMYDSLLGVLESLKLNFSDLNLLIPHQANIRIIKNLSEKIGLPLDKLVSCMETQANTSAASLILAMDTAVNEGRIKNNSLLGLAAIGSGLIWGSAIIRW